MAYVERPRSAAGSVARIGTSLAAYAVFTLSVGFAGAIVFGLVQ